MTFTLSGSVQDVLNEYGGTALNVVSSISSYVKVSRQLEDIRDRSRSSVESIEAAKILTELKALAAQKGYSDELVESEKKRLQQSQTAKNVALYGGAAIGVLALLSNI